MDDGIDDVLAAYVERARSLGETPNKIRAIRALRVAIPMDLAAAKAAVEDFGARRGEPTLEHNRSAESRLLWAALVIAAVAAAAGLFAAARAHGLI